MDPRGPEDASKVTRPTLKSGAPIGDKLNSFLLGPYGPNLLADVAYLEETAHFNRERIPERVVHAKGAAAFGKFVLTNTAITRYCSADMFSSKGKETPVAVRFSHVAGESGVADTFRDTRGFAVKFYTDEGNWDLVGNNLPVFFIRDPINFSSFIHTQKRNPKTHLKDPDAFWDFISLLPESMHAVTMLFSDRGTPDGFRHMHGFGVNTFKLVNAKNEQFYAKFHWVCDQKIKNLDQSASLKVASLDPDYSLRDLYTSIAKGVCPSWTFKFQAMSITDAERANFNVLDVTKTWPTAEFPLMEIGKMTLTTNPENYHADVEQLAFSPANMVRGIEPSADKMLMGRIMSYGDAQRYRLGVNYADMPCNQPRCPVMAPTYCDGITFMSNLKGSLPNYIPSSRFSSMKLYDETYLEHKQAFAGHCGRFDLSKEDNYSQARELVNRVLDEPARQRLASNIADHLKLVSSKEIKGRILGHFKEIEPKLACSIEQHMKSSKGAANPPAKPNPPM